MSGSWIGDPRPPKTNSLTCYWLGWALPHFPRLLCPTLPPQFPSAALQYFYLSARLKPDNRTELKRTVCWGLPSVLPQLLVNAFYKHKHNFKRNLQPLHSPWVWYINIPKNNGIIKGKNNNNLGWCQLSISTAVHEVQVQWLCTVYTLSASQSLPCPDVMLLSSLLGARSTSMSVLKLWVGNMWIYFLQVSAFHQHLRGFVTMFPASWAIHRYTMPWFLLCGL